MQVNGRQLTSFLKYFFLLYSAEDRKSHNDKRLRWWQNINFWVNYQFKMIIALFYMPNGLSVCPSGIFLRKVALLLIPPLLLCYVWVWWIPTAWASEGDFFSLFMTPKQVSAHRHLSGSTWPPNTPIRSICVIQRIHKSIFSWAWH